MIPAEPTVRPARGKAAALIAATRDTDGIGMDQIVAITGWTKFGGYYDAAKRADLKLIHVASDASSL